MDTTVNNRLTRVVHLRPSKSTRGPTKGTVDPTAMNWATISQIALSPEFKSYAITVKSVMRNRGITSATTNEILKPNIVITKPNVRFLVLAFAFISAACHVPCSG